MLKRSIKFPTLLLALIFAAALFIVTSEAALAHDRVEIGPYLIIIGWENEPPVVGDRNKLVVHITNEGEPVEDAEATLDLQVLYGGRTFTANLNPTDTPGFYKVEMYPTVRGQYVVAFTGTLGDTEVDVETEPEEVLPAAVLQFPESLPDTTALETDIEALTAQVASARLMAIIGIAVGVLGTAVGAVGLFMKRSK